MTDYLFLAFVFLGAGVIAVPIASRLGLGSVLGYLLAGIALSPLLVAIDVDVEAIQHVAEFGVVMMLFLVGLELHPERLWRMRTELLGLGGLQVLVTMLAIGLIAMAFGQTWQAALAVGMVLALSSTAIVVQTLNEKGLMRSDGGRSSFAVLLFQDIAVIPMLALLPLLAAPGIAALVSEPAEEGEDHGLALSFVENLAGWQAGLVTIGAVVAVMLIGRLLAAPVFRYIARVRLRELFTAAALTMVVGVALLMSLVGLSPALGTFLAGVMLADSEFRHELESDIEPFRGLFLGLFFISVGAGIDFALLFGELGLIVGLTLGLVALKCAVLLALGKTFGIEGAQRWLFALGLAQAGEFGFVLLAFTAGNGVLPAALADQLLLVVALSMLLTPVLFIVYERLIAPRFGVQQREADQIDEPGEIIIAGHGRFGGIVNRMLRGLGYETTVIDYSSEQLELLRTFDVHVYFGDATRPDLLRAAGIERARLLVIAIDDKEQITELVSYATRNFPKLHVIARARDRNHVYELWAAGCRDIIREMYDGSIRAARSALEALGATQADALRMAQDFETLDRRNMVDLAELHRLDMPNHLNPAYVAKVIEMREVMHAQLQGKVPEPAESRAPTSPTGSSSARPDGQLVR